MVVTIIRITQLEGTRYDVRWQEKHYGKNRELVSIENWGGLFTFVWARPKRSAPLRMYFRCGKSPRRDSDAYAYDCFISPIHA